MSTGEIWRDVTDFAGYYEVSNLGRVRSVDRTVPVRCWQRQRKQRGIFLQFWMRPSGHAEYYLSKNATTCSRRCDRLMREAGFVPLRYPAAEVPQSGAVDAEPAATSGNSSNSVVTIGPAA